MRISHLPVKGSILLSVCAIMLFPSASFAYSFTLSEAEFLAWPSYCKVVYLRNNIGQASGYQLLVSPAEIAAGSAVLREAERKGLGPYGGDGRHHFCAGMVWLERARLETNPYKRQSLLRQAESETRFTLIRADPHGESFALAAAQTAAVMYEAGDKIKALDILNDAISRPNMNPALFVRKAMIHYREGEYEKSRVVLEEGAKRANSVSAEIHYNLGLVLLKLGDPKSAADQAYLAYKYGYPLPGLRIKLERAGHWNPPD